MSAVLRGRACIAPGRIGVVAEYVYHLVLTVGHTALSMVVGIVISLRICQVLELSDPKVEPEPADKLFGSEPVCVTMGCHLRPLLRASETSFVEEF